MRNLSCFLTQPQVRDRSKTVSRRLGWAKAKPGDLLWIVVKGQGLKPGEQIQRMAAVELVAVSREPLSAITREDVAREGFPDASPAEFVSMFCHHMATTPDQEITRLEWKYREDIFRAFTDSRFPPTEGAITMARKGSNSANPPTPTAARMTEDQAKGEKDSVAAAFDQAGPGPGASVTSTKADPTAPPKNAGTVIPIDGQSQFVATESDDGSLPTFQQIFRRPLTDHDLAERFKSAGVLKLKKDEVEVAKKKSNDAFTKEINQLEAQIDAMLNQANAGADEKEITCRKRIDWDRGIATTFDAVTLEILERRQLNLKEIQVEMRWAGRVPPGKQGDVIAGPWPEKTAAPAEGEAPPETASAPAEAPAPAVSPVDTFTLPQSELDKQAPRKRGRPPKAKPAEETAPPPVAEDEGAGEPAPAGGIEAAFGEDE